MTFDQLPATATHFAAYASAGRTPKWLEFPAVAVDRYPSVLERCVEEGRNLVILGAVPTPAPKDPNWKPKPNPQKNPHARGNGRKNVLLAAQPDAPKTGKHILCIETGIVYASQSIAARELGISTGDVSKHLNDPSNRKSVRGYHLRRATSAEILKSQLNKGK